MCGSPSGLSLRILLSWVMYVIFEETGRSTVAPRFWLRRIVSCTVARADLRSQSARAARDFVGARHPLKAVQRCAVDEQLEMVIRLLSRCASPGGSSFTNPGREGDAGRARRWGARR